MNTARQRLALALQWSGTTTERLVEEAENTGPIVRKLLKRLDTDRPIDVDDLDEDDWDAALYLEQALHVCDAWLISGKPSIAAKRLLDELTLIEITGRDSASGKVVVSAGEWELLKLRAASVPGQIVSEPQH